MSRENLPRQLAAAVLLLSPASAIAANALPYDPEIAASTQLKSHVSNVRTIPRSIEAAQRLEFNQSVIIEGDVGERAVIRVSNGGIEIHGKVGEGAVIYANGPAVDIRAAGGSHTRIQTSGTGNVIIINGKQFTVPETLSGIKITGSIGKECQLATDGSIEAGNIGAKSQLTAGNSIQVGNVHTGAILNAENSITGKNVSENAHLIAGNSVRVSNVEAEARLEAKNSVTAADVTPGAYIKAGNSITVRHGDRSDMHAGNSVNIQQ